MIWTIAARRVGVVAAVTMLTGIAATPTFAQADPVAVDLVAGSGGAATVEIGDPLTVTWTVQNAGPESAEGVVLWIGTGAGIQPQDRHGNCVYYGNPFFPELPGSSMCTFDVVLEPGTTYAFSSPLGYEVRGDAPAPTLLPINGEWMTLADGAARTAFLTSEGRTGEPGTGPDVGLVEAGGGAPGPAPGDPLPAADVDPDNNFVTFEATVEGVNQHDLAAVGAQLTGAVGDRLTAELGVTNIGPSIASTGQSAEPLTFVRVTIPDGTTAVEVPDNCSAATAEGFDPEGIFGTPGKPVYLCMAGFLLPVDETEQLRFVLRIDDATVTAGLVQINQSIGQPNPADINPDNDEATIVVKVTSDGGTGGELPVTGAATWMVTVAGVLLIAFGAATVLLLQRRRTRFVA